MLSPKIVSHRPIKSQVDELRARVLLADVLSQVQSILDQLPDVDGKELIALLGGTGNGKSTFANWILGRTLKQIRTPGRTASGKAIEANDPVTPIGHDPTSCTAVPVLVAGTPQTNGIPIVDFPGIADTRGLAFDLATALASLTVLRRSSSVRVLVMVMSYQNLEALRGTDVRELEKTMQTLLGERYHDHIHSVRLLITKVPLDSDLDSIRTYLKGAGFPELIHRLSDTAIIYDPLNREIEGALNREQTLGQLLEAVPIAFPNEVFKFVLTRESEKALGDIIDVLSTDLIDLLGKGVVDKAADTYRQLSRLSMFSHTSIQKQLDEMGAEFENFFKTQLGAVKTAFSEDREDDGVNILDRFVVIQKAFAEFVGIPVGYYLGEMQDCKDNYQKQKALEKQANIQKVYRKVITSCRKMDFQKAQGRLDSLRDLVGPQDALYQKAQSIFTQAQKDHDAQLIRDEVADLTRDISLFCATNDFVNARTALAKIAQRVGGTQDASYTTAKAMVDGAAQKEQDRLTAIDAAEAAKKRSAHLQRRGAMLADMHRFQDSLEWYKTRLRPRIAALIKTATQDDGYEEFYIGFFNPSCTDWKMGIRHEDRGWLVFNQHGEEVSR